jgi:hypothetical protein
VMLKIAEGQKRHAALLELLRDGPADDLHDC